jgi:hypothetical protein
VNPPFEMTAGNLAGLKCPGCDSPLAIHQPEIEIPDRLLGTCESCGLWCEIDRVPGGDPVLTPVQSPFLA